MVALNHRRIALISVHGDPAVDIGKEEAGGQNVYVRQVGEALAELGWTVDMFTRRTNSAQPAVVEHAPRCRTIRLTAGPQEFIPRDEIFDALPSFLQEFIQYQQRLGIRYLLIHTNYWLSAWVGMEYRRRHLGVTHVHTYHSLGAVKYQTVTDIPPIANKRLEIEKRCLETASRIVATSPQEQEHMRSLVSTQGAITIIPCGTDIRRFGSIQRQEARQKLGLDPRQNIVFYVGRFDRRKGIETLVRAVGRSRFATEGNVQLIIGGGSRPGRSDGYERDRIEGIVAELGMSSFTTFPGRIDDADLAAYYAAANVCVVPSYYEPFGLVAIEAMASYTPVVASDVGGLQFTVESGNTGLLVPPLDLDGFADAIDRILEDPDWQTQLGKAARHRVESLFSWQGVAHQLNALYTELSAEHLPNQFKSSVA
ncbi:MAG: glycosyltransferase [Leptolyngbyaceae bacterium]|nr:glycosyltransferase [Leptolyngbyaceae bacterium]